jgi:hypothetical protein
MHQPCGEIVPSTVLHDDGASNKAQLSQRKSPFGMSWYLTAFCGAFAASAGADEPITAAAPPMDAPVAPAATINIRRREILFAAVILFCPFVCEKIRPRA